MPEPPKMPMMGWVCLFCDKYDPDEYASECQDMHEGIPPSCKQADELEKRLEVIEKATQLILDLHKTLLKRKEELRIFEPSDKVANILKEQLNADKYGEEEE